MDWGKTKTILIVAFLLLNVLLGYQLYLKYDESDYQLWGKGSEKEIAELLEEHDITITADLPNDKQTMNFIRANVLVIEGERPYSSINYDNITENNIGSILADSVRNINELIFSEQESVKGSQFVFCQHKSGFPIFGGRLTVDLTEHEIFRYKQVYFDVVGEGAGRQIISATRALRSTIDLQLIPNNSEIESLTLGYYGEGVQSVLDEIPPVWRLVYTADDIINVVHINAITGENVLKLG